MAATTFNSCKQKVHSTSDKVHYKAGGTKIEAYGEHNLSRAAATLTGSGILTKCFLEFDCFRALGSRQTLSAITLQLVNSRQNKYKISLVSLNKPSRHETK